MAQGLLEVGGAGLRRGAGPSAPAGLSSPAGTCSPAARGAVSRPRSQRSRTVSKARYGCTAEAP